MVDWRGGPPTGKAHLVRPRRMPAVHEPPVTIAEMLATYRAVAPKCSPHFAWVLRDIMARCAAGNREREPGDDDDVP